MDTKLITLNRDEVILISDRIINNECGTMEKPVDIYKLLIKVGSLYIDLVDPYNPTQVRESVIGISESEAWLLRSKVSSGDRVQSDSSIGVKLLRKIYRILIDFDLEDDIPALVSTDEPGISMDSQRKNSLSEWKEREKNDGLQPV